MEWLSGINYDPDNTDTNLKTAIALVRSMIEATCKIDIVTWNCSNFASGNQDVSRQIHVIRHEVGITGMHLSRLKTFDIRKPAMGISQATRELAQLVLVFHALCAEVFCEVKGLVKLLGRKRVIDSQGQDKAAVRDLNLIKGPVGRFRRYNVCILAMLIILGS